MKTAIFAALAAATLSVAGANAQAVPDTIKIGVLTDMSSLYADNTGPG